MFQTKHMYAHLGKQPFHYILSLINRLSENNKQIDNISFRIKYLRNKDFPSNYLNLDA